jgi:hypothetical protein
MREVLPPPLPPETRTVGQLIAESLRFYGQRFWQVLPLGVPLVALNQVHDVDARLAVVVAAPFLTLAYIAATTLMTGVRPTRRSAAIALVTGIVVLIPAAALTGWFDLLAVAWLAFAGFVVPVAIAERTSFRETFVRARSLSAVDFVHALGGLAALAICYALVRLALVVLLRSQGDQAERLAGALADLVLSPLLFLGAALLYVDQRARLDSRNAALHPSLDPLDAGRPDAQGEPRPAAGSQP